MRKLLLLSAIAIGALAINSIDPGGRPAPRAPDAIHVTSTETYRLVHAIGNTERVAQKGMGLAACRRQQGEMKLTATLIGAGGSVTCLPDSLFAD